MESQPQSSYSSADYGQLLEYFALANKYDVPQIRKVIAQSLAYMFEWHIELAERRYEPYQIANTENMKRLPRCFLENVYEPAVEKLGSFHQDLYPVFAWSLRLLKQLVDIRELRQVALKDEKLTDYLLDVLSSEEDKVAIINGKERVLYDFGWVSSKLKTTEDDVANDGVNGRSRERIGRAEDKRGTMQRRRSPIRSRSYRTASICESP